LVASFTLATPASRQASSSGDTDPYSSPRSARNCTGRFEASRPLSSVLRAAASATGEPSTSMEVAPPWFASVMTIGRLAEPASSCTPTTLEGRSTRPRRSAASLPTMR